MQHFLFIVAGVAMVAAGVLLLRAVIHGIARQRTLETRLARASVLTQAQQRVRARLASEEETGAAIVGALPGLVRELNRGDLEPQDVPPLILKLVEAVFRPDHVLLYVARAGEGGADPVLRLATQKGYERVPESLQTVPLERGKIGWVARHRVVMRGEDWIELARTEGIDVADDHPAARLDVAGPLVHHVVSGEQTLGVLCVGSPRIRPQDCKSWFQFASHIGSLALVNAYHLSKLRDLANTDVLTGLRNKRCFLAELTNLLIAAERENREVALLLFEVDRFKEYEDARGHLEGARVLRRMAATLREHLRPEDRSCYYGGEWFAAALPDTGAEAALDAAESIRLAVEESASEGETPQAPDGPTLSGGLAVFPGDGTSVAELTRRADRALSESRQRGGNRVTRCRGASVEVEA